MAQQTTNYDTTSVQSSVKLQREIDSITSNTHNSNENLNLLDKYSDLNLSGNIISATFCIPYSLRYVKGSNWGLNPRRGKSSLVDSFTHLSSDEIPWNHTLVGWTGEITIPDNYTPPLTPPATTLSSRYSSLNKSSAPIPVDVYSDPLESNHSEGLWITKDDMDRLEQQLGQDKNFRILPVWLGDRSENPVNGLSLKDQAKWRLFAEHNLYTPFHYKQNEVNDAKVERQSWADYYHMNQIFASRILELYKPGDIVIMHDFHLLILPNMLRQLVPDMYISFFLHVPFPSSEILRCLPRRREILACALGADLIGFQSPSIAAHFVSCCSRILGFSSDMTGVEAYGRKVTVGTFPIGINARAVEKAAFENPVIDKKVKALRSLYAGKKLIVGRDRLDTVRGVAQKLIAFERFLADFPEWQGKVVLIKVTSRLRSISRI